MTMRVIFTKDFDGYKSGKEYYVERTLAVRFCGKSIAMPYQKYQDMKYEEEQAAKVKPEVLEVPEVPEEVPEVEKPAITPKRNTKRR